MRAGDRGRQEDGNEEQGGEREEGGREGVKEEGDCKCKGTTVSRR